ncbi:MAG: GNAT family N-acetyltransferase [Alphaproteobacteria bacterium]|nr:GNAT family N-acetyltransferase [Alphaproteobacteria bacterium]
MSHPPDATRTDRFTIRSWMPGDGAALQPAAVSSYDHLKPFMPWADAEQSVEQSEALVRRFRGLYLTGEDFVLGIFAPDGSVLGGTGFHLREGPIACRQAEIGMWIRADVAHAGLGTAVLRELVRWGFTDWPWLRLSWKCNSTNVASRRAAEKAGFVFEGEIRGEHDAVTGGRRLGRCYSILREDWEAQPLG